LQLDAPPSGAAPQTGAENEPVAWSLLNIKSNVPVTAQSSTRVNVIVPLDADSPAGDWHVPSNSVN